MAGLAKLGTRDAWKLVIEALSDPEPEVADEAELRLAEIADPRVLRTLSGPAGLRSRDELVRLRVAEALGRSRVGVDGEDLARALSRGEAEVTRMALFSLERLAGRRKLKGNLDAIRRRIESAGLRHREGSVRAAALAAFAALSELTSAPGDELEHHLAEGLRDPHPEARCAALSIAGTRPGALEASRRLAGDPSFSVRAQAVENLAALQTRAGLVALVLRLEREARPALRWRIVARLQELTGRKYRQDARPWELHVEGLEPDWEPGPAAAEMGDPGQDPGPDPGARTRAFAHLPTLSDRLCFLIDLSGSLWTARAGKLTRKDLIDQKLREALESLDPGARFNVIPYTYGPMPWSERLVESKRKNVRNALEAFERSHATGKGNFFDAAVLALEDPEVDTIVVFTDGEPTGGIHWNLGLLFALLHERNRFKGVAFDSILVDAHVALQRRWAEFSAATGGRSVAFDFE